MGEARLPGTLDALLRQARTILQEAGIAGAAYDARLIVEHFAGITQADLIASPGRAVAAAQAMAVLAAARQRAAGKPVHRILGYREFYGLKLMLSAETLEPRPDTETLVDLVLPHLRETVRRRGSCTILDMGTGTGAIALALLSAVPEARAVGTDISDDALATARTNADMNGYSERFVTRRSDWFGEIEESFDLIVSNPPYIATAEMDELSREVREHDPVNALHGGVDGLDAYRQIAAEAVGHLNAAGAIAVEIGSSQAADVKEIFASNSFQAADAAADLAGHDRAILFIAC
ncbi:peptide chain release factor N(5)-glutamine methyltransferase [Nitratireductor luteus]|uniref:peptide chain release factor N(5)-glutamine methyltransferase n=1 Tax=Nitratireductor luteus TaxID=2976980 RepID=UPI00223F9CB7|nr:peptide chain release factor N(5)-glutamine methyltransferase [Nitratireductor luteus]